MPLLLHAPTGTSLHIVNSPRTAFCAAMLDGPPRLGIQKKPLVSRPSSAALLSALQTKKTSYGSFQADCKW
jgi:hypothetical protein